MEASRAEKFEEAVFGGDAEDTEDTPLEEPEDSVSTTQEPESEDVVEPADTIAEPSEPEEPAPDGEEPVDPETPVEVAEPTEPTEPTAETPEAQATPFSFKADGTQVEVPGAVVVEHEGPEGDPTRSIVIPEDAWQGVVRHHIADRSAWSRKAAEYQRQIADLDPEKNETVIRAQTALEGVEKLLEMDRDEFVGWLENFEENKERLKLQMENRALKAQAEGATAKISERETQEEAQRLGQQLATDLPAAVDATIERLGANFPGPVAQQLKARLLRDASRFYYRAEEGDPFGLEPGKIGRRDDLIEQEIQFAHSLYSTREERASKAKEAEEKNKAALGEGEKKAPTTVPAKGGPAPAGKAKKVENKEDWKELMGIN